MQYSIMYEESVIKNDIPNLDRVVKYRIKEAIEKKLTSHPSLYGKPLRNSLHGYYKLRVGDYRVIFRIDMNVIRIFAIEHSSYVHKVN